MDPQQDMDCLARERVDSHRRSRVGSRQRVDAALRSIAALSLLVWSSYAAAIGTGAGTRIDSTANMTFDVAGVAQPIVASNTVTLDVNEVLDAVVVSQDASAVSVASGATGAWLSFSVANTGNGSEPFRLVVDVAITGDDFDPTSPAIYIETNGTPGLQIGAGGDTPYVIGSNDPVLVRDSSVSVYVAANIPVGLPQNALGRASLRAVPRTVFAEAGTDDPANSAFPLPGTAYPGAGDPALGGGNVIAVVGSTFASGSLRLRAHGAYRVNAAVVTLNKTVTSVTDPGGGARLIPGAIVHYRIDVSVAGSDAAQGLVVRDPMPADLAYVASSLAVAPLPAGQQADDDFAPTGSDNTGFDGPNNTVVVTLGNLVGGSTPVVISFNATIK